MRQGGALLRHGSSLTMGVSARGVLCMRPSYQSQLLMVTIDSLQPGHGQPPSGSRRGSTNLFRDHSAYRIGPRELHHMTK